MSLEAAERRRQVWESFCRYTLGDLLYNVFEGPEKVLREYGDEEFEDYLRTFLEHFTIDKAWSATMDPREPLAPSFHEPQRAQVTAPYLPRDARTQVAEAFATLRGCATAVATGQPTPPVPMTLDLYIPPSAADRSGRARWMLRGRLADGIVWMGLKLLTEVDRSLIRMCKRPGCDRVYVATKNQQYCPNHQGEARRQAQRRAERAFRDRQRDKKKRGKR